MRSRSANKSMQVHDPFSYEINGHSMSIADCDPELYASDVTQEEVIEPKISVVNFKSLQPEVKITIDNRPIKKRRRIQIQDNDSGIHSPSNSALLSCVNVETKTKDEPVNIISSPEIHINEISTASSSNNQNPTTTCGAESPQTSSVGLPEKDSDYHFLMSLLPYMQQMNSILKLRIRTKIQTLIFKELYDVGGGGNDVHNVDL